HGTVEGAFHGHFLQRCSHLRVEPEHMRHSMGLVCRHGGLSHQRGSDPHLVPPHSLGNGCKGETLRLLGGQDLFRCLCTSDHDALLLWMMVGQTRATLSLMPQGHERVWN